MSTIRKKPYVEEVLGRLNATQLGVLKSAMNAGTPEAIRSLINPANKFTALTNDAPYDIAAYQVQLEPTKWRNGMCVRLKSGANVYEDLFVYGESQKITIYKLDTAHATYELIEEYCDINEFRRVCDEIHESAGDAWVETMKTVMDYDSENSEVEIGTHLYVDGRLEVGDTGGTAGDVVIGHELIIDDLQKIVDTNGDAFIPDPSGHLNEALVHYTSGYTWKKGYELAGFEVVAKSVFEGDGYVYQTHKVYFVWNDTAGDHYGEVYVRYYEA